MVLPRYMRQMSYTWPLSIVHFEMLNVMNAFCLWGGFGSNKEVKVHCDNAAVVSILNSRKSRDPFLSACAHTLWLIKADFNINVTVVHIPGHSNIYADILSQLCHYKNLNNSIVQYLKSCTWYNVDKHSLCPDFSI